MAGARTVLVTGAAGYIGSILCERLLAAGYRVLAYDALIYGQHSLFHLCNSPAFDFVTGDVCDLDRLRPLVAKADVIIPLAAIVGAPACDRNQLLARAVNYQAVVDLNGIRSREQLVVFPVTNSGYGTTDGTTYCTEASPLKPISLYGRTKVEAEAELLASENVITVRLATVFGMSPRMRLDLLVNHFVYAAVTDGYLVLFESHFKRNFIHIRDVADLFVHCIENSVAMGGRPYNAGLEDANLSKLELAERIKARVPDFWIQTAPIGQDVDKRNYIVSNQRLAEAGFKACRSLDDGIVELLKGYRMLGRRALSNAYH